MTPPNGDAIAGAVTRRAGPRAVRAVGWYLVVAGAAIASMWALSLPGPFGDGLFVYAGTDDAGNIPAFHVVAEASMAILALVAGLRLLVEHRRARGIALVAIGMLTYSTVNSSGWLVHNQPPTVTVTAVALAGALLSARVLLAVPPEVGRSNAELVASGSAGRDRAGPA